jgi:hypothetical protein
MIWHYRVRKTHESTPRMQNKTCNASLPERRAALETLTFARTDYRDPHLNSPAIPEHKTPMRKEATVIYADVTLRIQDVHELSRYGFYGKYSAGNPYCG